MYKLGCEAAMKVRGDDTLEGAQSFLALFDGISSILGGFLETLAEMGSIHWVGVQTWQYSAKIGQTQAVLFFSARFCPPFKDTVSKVTN